MTARHLGAVLILLLGAIVSCSGGSEDPGGSAAATTPTTSGSTAAPTSAVSSHGSSSSPPDPTTEVTRSGNTASAPPSSSTTIALAAGPLAGRVIVVDPGHNGANGRHTTEINRPVDAGGFKKACNTTGTADSGYPEATFTWELASRLATALRNKGATVVLTRQSNSSWGPCVDARGQTAARSNADMLISLHADGSSAGNRGFHVISAGESPAVSSEIAAASGRLADLLRDALIDAEVTPSNYTGRQGRVVRRDLGTLNRSPAPAAMIEFGNMHNAADLRLLRSADGQQRLADAVASASTMFAQSLTVVDR